MLYTGIDVEEFRARVRSEVVAYHEFMGKADSQIQRGCAATLHEYVIGVLFQAAKEANLFPIPEYMPTACRKRLDLVCLGATQEIVAAFEVDKTVYPKSVLKLAEIRDKALRVVISIGLGKHPLNLERVALLGICHWDFTQKALGILNGKLSRPIQD